MNTKTNVVAFLFVTALYSAAPQPTKYPAGVDPQACPNYPDCDNTILASYSIRNSAPSRSSSSAQRNYDPLIEVAGVVTSPKFLAYPAGVDPSVCPNYPFCGPTPSQVLADHKESAWRAPSSGWDSPATENRWPTRTPQNEWSAPVNRNPWSAPTDYNTWTTSDSHGSWSGPSSPNSPNGRIATSSNNFWNSPEVQSSSNLVTDNNISLDAHENGGTWTALAYHKEGAEEDSSPAQGGARYPAGVDPRTCPNYPFCY